MKILITAATTAQAHKLKNSLQNIDIILGDFTDLPAFMRKDIIKLPTPSSDTYTHEMLKICLDESIDELHALMGEEASVLLQSQQLFNEYNITIIDGSRSI